MKLRSPWQFLCPLTLITHAGLQVGSDTVGLAQTRGRGFKSHPV